MERVSATPEVPCSLYEGKTFENQVAAELKDNLDTGIHTEAIRKLINKIAN